jgi:phosphoribosyl 1,2-cyclic phosphodiesterase
MRVVNLSSGSESNMTYVESDEAKILIDIGLSCKEAENRLKIIGIQPYEITAILVTHEHGDHIKGIDNFASKHDIPVFAHYEVWYGLGEKLKKLKNENRKMYAGEEFGYKDVIIKAIKVPHDVPCFAYSIIKHQKKISILTDLGHTTDRILESVRGSNIVYLEANYDEKMLKEGTKYPLPLKKRIGGQFGHLSNTDTAKAILYLAKYGTKQFVLSHLSKENNTPDLAFDYITNIIRRYGIIEGVNIKIDVASTNIGTIFKIV